MTHFPEQQTPSRTDASPTAGSQCPSFAYNVRITALRKADYKDLQQRYENPIAHACDIEEGQTWLSVGGKQPGGLCDSAWESMRWFVEELADGRGNFFDGWMRNPSSALISCNDGFRPVSFLLERMPDTGPVS